MTWNRQLFMHCQVWTVTKSPTCPNHQKCKKAKSWNLGMKSSWYRKQVVKQLAEEQSFCPSQDQHDSRCLASHLQHDPSSPTYFAGSWGHSS
jgi:hypothetical protein